MVYLARALMLVHLAHHHEPATDPYRQALLLADPEAEVWYVGRRPDAQDQRPDRAPTREVGGRGLLGMLLSQRAERRHVVVSDALPRAVLAALTPLASLGVTPLLASERGLHQAAASGLPSSLDLTTQAALARGYRGYVTPGLLGEQYLASLGCPHDRIVRGLRPIDLAASEAPAPAAHADSAEAYPATVGLRRRLGARPFVALVVVQPSAPQRVTELLRAFSELRKTVPGAAMVVLGGLTQSPWAGEVSRLGLAGDVFLTPREPAQHLWEYRALADAHVHVPVGTSWGDSLLEAAASRLPLVTATTVGAAGDLVVHGRTGALVYAGDVESLRQGLHLVATGDRRAMGQAARARAQQFDVGCVGHALRELLDLADNGPADHASWGDIAYAHSKNHYGRWPA